MAQLPQPNIVVILSDDLGYGDISHLNPDSRIKTPRMDKFAARGMVFTDAHSNSAVCTPTRYGVLTGRHCWRGRLKSGVLWGYSPALIERGRPTVASLLSRAGYRTACIGKWHLGLGWSWPENYTPTDAELNEDPGIDYSKKLSDGPHTCGFAESFILPASLDMPPYCYIQNASVVESPTERATESRRPAMWRSGAMSPGFKHEDCLHKLTQQAEAFIDKQGREEPNRPFFLYFATPSPHTPHVPREPFVGKSQAGPYGDLVVEHDWSIGCLLDALERNGFTENTLVIITSDNGAHIRGNDFDFEKEFGHRSNHIYRGQKSDCWEGGHRVPFLVRWPAAIQPGSVCNETICLTDILATVAEINETDVPTVGHEDSVSFAPLLRGKSLSSPRPPVIHHSINGNFAIRSGPWKLIVCRGSGGWSLPEGKAGTNAPKMQLFHIQRDPSEAKNLVESEPEVTAKLLEALAAIRRDD